jgi:ferritin-like metal-binding protein YciE
VFISRAAAGITVSCDRYDHGIRLKETFIDDFRKELSEIQGPVARHIFILAKLNHLTNFRIGEYAVLTAAADMSGSYAVGVLLETSLADKVAFADRTKRLIRNLVETRVAERKLEQVA